VTDLDSQQIAEHIARLRPAPRGWVQAAQELPAARRAVETLVARAQQSEEERAAIVRNLEESLHAQGVEPRSYLVRELRDLLADDG
jgi:hypothetical protein